MLCQEPAPGDAALGGRGRDGPPARTSAACCPSTSPTTTRASTRGRSTSSPTPRSSTTSRPTSRRCAEVAALGRRRAGQPPDHGPGDPRARAGRRRPVRGQDPRLGARVRRQAAPALPPVGARGAGAGARDPRRLAAHGGEPVGGAGRRRRERTRLGPPGVDVERVRAARAGGGARRRARRSRSGSAGSRPAGRARSPATRPRRARALREADGRLVVFVGKLIASKGVHLLLAAWPQVLREHPDARLLIVGFGGFREALEALRRRRAAHPRRGRHELARRFRRRRRCRSSASPSPAASSTTSSPTCCPPPRRWSRRALPRGVRDGRRRGRGRRRAAGRRPPFGAGRGLRGARRARAGRRRAPGCRSPSGPDAVDELAACLTGWLGAPEDVRAAHAGGDRGRHARALVLGRRRPHGARRRRRATSTLCRVPDG